MRYQRFFLFSLFLCAIVSMYPQNNSAISFSLGKCFVENILIPNRYISNKYLVDYKNSIGFSARYQFNYLKRLSVASEVGTFFFKNNKTMLDAKKYDVCLLNGLNFFHSEKISFFVYTGGGYSL